MQTKTHISWLILVYDRTAEERFPLKRKWYVFSYKRASPEETEAVIRLCKGKDCSVADVPFGMGQAKTTFSVGASAGYTDPTILKYRYLFDYIAEYETQGQGTEPDFDEYRGVNLRSDTYYEDENEKPITLVQIFDEEMKRLSGKDIPAIIMDEPASIIRLEPVEPIRKELWKNDNFEVIRLFFKQFNYIWFRSPCSVSLIAGKISDYKLPLEEDCLSIILPFRQMYDSNDDLFNTICNIYKNYCPKEHPTFEWINFYKKQFNEILQKPVDFPIFDCKLTARRYLNAFAYGARIIHVKSNKDEPVQDFDLLLRSLKPPMLTMGYHAVLRSLMRPIAMTTGVLHKNFSYWYKVFGEDISSDPIASDVFNPPK